MSEQERITHRAFKDRIKPAVCGGGFWMDDYWVWGSSVGRAEDGVYHLFASRWPKSYPFFQGYTAKSEIVRATSDTPVGPFKFQEVVLGERESHYWDGRMTHNPCLYRGDRGWYLFYCGVTYADADAATPEAMWTLNRDPSGSNGKMPSWFHDMRSGVAFAEHLGGPWQRPDEPLAGLASLSRSGNQRVVNVTAVRTPGGGCRLFYRNTGTGLITAEADTPTGPYSKAKMRVVADHQVQAYTEDPCAFRVQDHYEVLTKDASGKYTGEPFALLHNLSRDGESWSPAPEPKACSRQVLWDDGQVRHQGNLERPFVLIEEGEPAYLYAATCDGVHTESRPAHYHAEHTWNMVIPLVQAHPDTRAR